MSSNDLFEERPYSNSQPCPPNSQPYPYNSQPCPSDSWQQNNGSKKPFKMTKLRYGVYYLVFCAALFMFWQLVGAVLLKYNTLLEYTVGYDPSYITFSSYMLGIWIAGSIGIGIRAACAKE